MKLPVDSRMFIAIIAVVVVISAAIIVWIYRAPPGAVAQSTDPDAVLSGAAANSSKGAARNAEMRDTHSGPTPDQRKQIEEWKKAHPDGYTRQ